MTLVSSTETICLFCFLYWVRNVLLATALKAKLNPFKTELSPELDNEMSMRESGRKAEVNGVLLALVLFL